MHNAGPHAQSDHPDAVVDAPTMSQRSVPSAASAPPALHHAGPDPGAPPRLQLKGISKVYPTVVANDRVDLAVRPGEIRAILGENGAGKSTLMKIIYGVTHASAGQMLWEGREVQVANPAHARRLGIGMVFQHFSLFETLTVAENIAPALDRERAGGDLPGRIREVSARYGLPLDPDRHVHTMSVGERQRVEIVRCLLQDPRLLIMDEPTSVLTPQAVSKLFETLRRLSAEGCSILYISHKLDEIRALCHHCTVLRGGKVTGVCNPQQETNTSLSRMMIGAEPPALEHHSVATGDVVLNVSGLRLERESPFGVDLDGISMQVRAGEVVGIAGVPRCSRCRGCCRRCRERQRMQSRPGRRRRCRRCRPCWRAACSVCVPWRYRRSTQRLRR